MNKKATVDEMLDFGQYVFAEGVNRLIKYKEQAPNFIYQRNDLIKEKRLAVVNIVHGIELIFKAILLNNDYLINKLKIRPPIKNDESIGRLLNSEQTIEFSVILCFFKKQYSKIDFKAIEKLNKIRNQIQHRGTRIDEKSKWMFTETFDTMTHLYKKEFPKRRKFVKLLEESRDKI